MMVPDAVRQSIELDVKLARIHSRVTERPWGLLFANPANPQHHDSNSARCIRADQPEEAIAQLTAFYRERGLTPRAKVNDLTAPQDFGARLAAHGYLISPAVLRVMTWNSSPPSRLTLPAGVTIIRAGLQHLVAVTRVQMEGFGSDDSSWISGFLRVELAHPNVRCYLACIDDVAAATLSVFDSDPVSLVENVATVPAFRGRGLATALLALAQSESRGPLLLEVIEENAERIYRRASFEVRGELHQASYWLPE